MSFYMFRLICMGAKLAVHDCVRRVGGNALGLAWRLSACVGQCVEWLFVAAAGIHLRKFGVDLRILYVM
jgi:hypothetical protein